MEILFEVCKHTRELHICNIRSKNANLMSDNTPALLWGTWPCSLQHCTVWGLLPGWAELMSFNYGSIFFRPSKLKSSSDHHKLFFFGVFIFSIGITRCIFCFISKIIGRGYNILCFHRYFDVMLFFIGNSQCFCIASNFPNVVSQLFFRCLYKSISTRHINHYRGHQLDQFKCYSMQQYIIVEQ